MKEKFPVSLELEVEEPEKGRKPVGGGRISAAGLVVWAFCSAPCLASTAQVLIGGDTWSISTNSVGGNCVVTPLGGDLGTNVTCTDGANSVRANTVTQCIFTMGIAACVKGDPTTRPLATTELDCGSNNVYRVTTGSNAQDPANSCTEAGTGSGKEHKVDCTFGASEAH